MESPATLEHAEAIEPFVFVDLHDPDAWVEVEKDLPEGSGAPVPVVRH